MTVYASRAPAWAKLDRSKPVFDRDARRRSSTGFREAPTLAFDENLAQRMRIALGDGQEISEKRMMGGVCFFAQGNMVCGADRSKQDEPRFMFRVGKGNEVAATLSQGIPMVLGDRPMPGFCFRGKWGRQELMRHQKLLGGGEGGIRTHGTVAGTPHFECGAFDLSATSPHDRMTLGRQVAGMGRGRPLAAVRRIAKPDSTGQIACSAERINYIGNMSPAFHCPKISPLPATASARWCATGCSISAA